MKAHTRYNLLQCLQYRGLTGKARANESKNALIWRTFTKEYNLCRLVRIAEHCTVRTTEVVFDLALPIFLLQTLALTSVRLPHHTSKTGRSWIVCQYIANLYVSNTSMVSSFCSRSLRMRRSLEPVHRDS